ncbi:MAG: hypothetical protein L0332_20665 [Chloroflexi bacterium]|nr:hypothetical protein [Chloroflexota bacterium]MCI0729112.1 hypothetical protein [Chloroflexota bacterium]
MYNLDNSEWKPIPFDKPDDCRVGGFGHLGRLPNGNLGFTYECHFEEIGFQTTLYMWDLESETWHTLYEFPESFAADDFSFAPDMSGFLQESTGDGIFNELYQVNEAGELNQLFPDYYRAGVPAWSPVGNTIAFAATKEGPEASTNLFSGAPGLQEAMYHPWDIYLMDTDGDNLRVLLPDVVGVHIIKWSPEGNRLAFWGTYNDDEGIWILNMATSKLARTWPEEILFDWSPDGQQLVLLAQEERDGETWRYPIIIDVPAEMAD